MVTPDAWPNTTCICTAVRRADRALTRVYDEALRPSGLVTTQFSLLSIIARAPQAPSLGELADAQAMDRTTLSRNLAPLVRRGLVRITRGNDRRIRFISLTVDGASHLDTARPLWRLAQESVTHEAGGERLARLLDDLTLLVDQVRERPQASTDVPL